MPLSPQQLLELEMETAWENFCDADELQHARILEAMDPNFYQMMKLAYQHGYSDGAQSVYRSLQK